MELNDWALQDRYAPEGICFGCGAANAEGLRIKSHSQQVADVGEEVVARWTPQAHHQAFEGMISGGIIGTLLDCHSNWTAAHAFMLDRGDARPPSTVTADYAVTLRRPTPFGEPLTITASAAAVDGDRCTVNARVEADGKVTATCVGHFVAVREGHPAYGRW
jgi:acyl-coenzyme A thioesterase PaaI-like protein